MDHQPSQTALTAAAARAAHLIVDDAPLIFSDTLAYTLLGDRAEEFIGFHRARGEHPILAGARAAVVIRSRYTEDRLAAAVRDGITQYVILGAGLDSFGYRSALAERVRVFEVDHPATQRWKRHSLAEAGITTPETLTFVPVDLEAESPTDHLLRGGFDRSRPALVSWLGVTMYLTREAIDDTLAMVGGLAPGTEIVTDYFVPPDLRDAAGQTYAEGVGAAAAERGEPWLSAFSPQEMSALLDKHGFGPVEQVGQRDAVDPALWKRTDSLHPIGLSMLAHASTAP
jgi:methyltransferase (TIGR00027 family)